MKQIFTEIEKKQDENIRLKAYMRLVEEALIDNNVEECKLLLSRAKEIVNSGKIASDKLSDIRLEMYCLEILYLQKIRSSQEQITILLKEAQSLNTDVSNSKVKAVIKENMGKMFVYE